MKGGGEKNQEYNFLENKCKLTRRQAEKEFEEEIVTVI